MIGLNTFGWERFIFSFTEECDAFTGLPSEKTGVREAFFSSSSQIAREEPVPKDIRWSESRHRKLSHSRPSLAMNSPDAPDFPC